MPEIYRSQHTGTIADLIGRQGMAGARALAAASEAQANAAVQRGQAWGGAIQNIGNTVSGTLADVAKQRQDAPAMRLRGLQADQIAAELSAMDTLKAQTEIGRLAQMVKASGYDPSTAEPIFQAIAKLSPEYAQPLQRSLMEPQMLRTVTEALISQTPGYKAPEPERPFEINGKLVKPSGEVVYEAPPEPEKPVVVSGRLVKPSTGEVVFEPPAEPEKPTNPTEASLAMMAAQGNSQAAAALAKLRSLRAPQRDTEPLMAVMGDDGQPVYMPRSQAIGRRPASNREQGRPVVSGDANRIADLDTALDDLETLSGTIQGVAGSTGTSAQIGAALPNWVTEWTGRGASAKSKQAVIDRVKQVIGKALEGGVLRKEDEVKYAKILPTIGDVPDVVKTKLEGLQEAITQRRRTTLDALSDAGYDVTRFQQRERPSKQIDDPVDALIKKYGGGE